MNEVTRIVSAIQAGEPKAVDELLPLVYQELHRLAAHKLAQEKPGQTFSATDLVHEAYLRLVGDANPQEWDGRGHFFAAAAEAMRRILVENARRKARLKHGGEMRRVTLEPHGGVAPLPDEDILALDEALERLAEEDSPRAELVKLRFFAGLSIEEAASSLRISRATADRDWAYARAWLFERVRRT